MSAGNRFGREIEFREGAPIQLLQYVEDNSKDGFGEIVLNPVALNILQTIREPLAIISVALSSTFIYNINGIVGRDDIGKLYLMTDLSNFIQEPEEGDFLPRLVILLRDFTLENPESFKDYFLEKLNNVNSEAAKGIKKFFYDFDVYGLPHPGCKRKMLQHMEDADTDELDEEFVDEDYWERYVKIGLNQENLFESNDEFQEALKAFELAYEKSMMKSSEAAKVIASYMQNQYPTAIEYMTQLGRMNAELAKAMKAKEEAETFRLEALAREEEFHREIEAQKHEREESERNFKTKMEELRANIDQQTRSHEEMKERLIKERDITAEKYNQKFEQLHNEMLEQQKLNEEDKRKLLEQQQAKFEQIQREAEEENRKRTEELKELLRQDKEKAIEKQNEFFQKQLTEQIAANQKQYSEIIDQIRRDNENWRTAISNSRRDSSRCVIS
ncbi:hypothetical protein RhiirA5_404242 [Rhizophagus irregularis]|uniref:Guanylate-binding protein N-terminal domain-containing protein n=1 Tax=Rhizophagus irregularis TaxID=588596 RepID=A0A2I1FFW8_9GLOM|nr:hypothetical protein RhiirA5_404242 [Rhizophagus irregularis]PKC55314.1 hypothetical protein RhiirA1_503827 [Rhizophagus irregularis]PKY33269.1 hypothetical protein RhiirB3_494501 [Rhizophagus irregularis]